MEQNNMLVLGQLCNSGDQGENQRNNQARRSSGGKSAVWDGEGGVMNTFMES